MKAQQKKTKGLARQGVFEFSHARPKNHLRVTRSSTEVWILAARDNFSARDKTAFVHYLAAEGFIPERYLAFSAENKITWKGLEWLIEESYAGSKTPAITRKADVFMARLLGCELLLWIAQLAGLWSTSR